MVEIKMHFGNYTGTLAPASEIEELQWFTSKNEDLTPIAGKLILRWLKEQGLIE